MTAVMTASAIALGGSVVANKVTLGRHDERIGNIENLSTELLETQHQLSQTRIALAKLEGVQQVKNGE